MAIASLAIITRAFTPHVRAYTWSPEPRWLHTLGQIAGTLLLLELMLALVLVLAIAGGLAFVAYWTHKHVVPLIGEYSARAKQVVDVGARAGDRVVAGVAEFHGRRMGLETALRVFFLGPQAADGLVRRAPDASPLAAEAPLPLARPVTTDAPHTAPTPMRPTTPTQPTSEPRAERRPATTRYAPSPTMALRETPPIAPSTSVANAPTVDDQPTHGAAPIAPANAMQRAAPLTAALPIGRAGTPSGMRAGMSSGVGFLGS